MAGTMTRLLATYIEERVNLPPYNLISDQNDWLNCLERLRSEPRLAIDLEANSLYAYREQICLIQITIPGQDYIVDPLADIDVEGLGFIIEDASVEKVFHAAEYDLILMKRQHGWECQNLFDTMWAARILGLPRCGLANLLSEFYQVDQNKKHQKANWCRRPLGEKMLTYAQLDTHLLLQLRDDLTKRLRQNRCLAEAQEIFSEQCHIKLNDNSFDPNDFWNINGVRDLPPKKRAIVKALFIYRDQQAKKLDRPPFKVFGNRTILELAEAAPRYIEELTHIHGMSKGQIRRYGRSILEIIEQARNDRPPRRRKSGKRPPDEVYCRYETLHNWRKQKAKRRGVESDVILSRDTLWNLAWSNPQTPSDLRETNGLGPWRLKEYGQEILSLLDSNQ
jgi:ribonuclease D